jgi:hypothetical protein
MKELLNRTGGGQPPGRTPADWQPAVITQPGRAEVLIEIPAGVKYVNGQSI